VRILIANRGEIARRVIRTAHALGHETVAVYAEPDAGAPHTIEATQAVLIGPAPLAESYLSAGRLLDAAHATHADAVHPGYGFLSENTAFAQAVIDAGLIWIGPTPDAISRMGSKIEARRLASDAGVPIIPGFDESQDDDALAAAAGTIGYPVLVKASAGGGGKGIRIAHSPDDFADALAAARSEGERSFGSGAMIVERYVQRPRHVEVQIVGDKHGNMIDLGTRECSVQRRYQKVLEEAPAPNLPAGTRAGLRTAARELAASIGYDSTGTVEFIVDDEDPDSFFFLEMNTRLQVEHPVTEYVTGLDLVELQIRVAAGEPLPVTQAEVVLVGNAFEARINAEDPANDFAPQTGTIRHLHVPDGVRWDSAIEAGSEISPHYDPMVAKLIVGGPDREVARARLAAALDELIVGGLVTNTGFHRWLVDRPEVVSGRVTTRFLDETDVPAGPDPQAAAEISAAVFAAAIDAGPSDSPWRSLPAFGVTPYTPTRRYALQDSLGDVHEVTLHAGSAREAPPALVDVAGRSVAVNIDGHSVTHTVLTRSDHWAPGDDAGRGSAHAIAAPFPAVVAEVAVAPGDDVVAGDAIVIIEAMKMLHTLAATGPGTVAEVRVAVGDQVAAKEVLVTFVEPMPESEEPESKEEAR
jgi:acetyl/propionyl-CoA carboxylase alpha subunit